MAYRELMRFERAHARWKKMVRGRRYVVTCAELNTPKTREGSRQAANEWMEARLQEDRLRAGNFEPRSEEEHETARKIEYLDLKIAYAKEKAPDELPGLEKERIRLIRGRVVDGDSTGVNKADLPDENEETAQGTTMAGLRALGFVIPPGLEGIAYEWLSGREMVWNERLRHHRSTPDRFKIGTFLENFLQEARRIEKPSTAGELRRYLTLIIREAGIWTVHSDIRSIDSNTVKKFVDWLFSKDYTAGTHNKVLGFFRRFVKATSEEDGMLENLPKNLFKKNHRKFVEDTEVTEFKDIVLQTNLLPKKFRSWVLLALNCGCSSADLGRLKWDNIDTSNWRLTRRRVKTETTNRKAPKVTYKLWPETIRMLQALPDRSSFIFKTKNGSPLYVSRFEGDKTITKDLFSSYWQKLKSCKPTFTLGKIRSIGSSIIENDPLEIFVSKHSILYNGRKPKTIDDKHYLRNRLTFMDAALDYLRTELRIVDLEI